MADAGILHEVFVGRESSLGIGIGVIIDLQSRDFIENKGVLFRGVREENIVIVTDAARASDKHFGAFPVGQYGIGGEEWGKNNQG